MVDSINSNSNQIIDRGIEGTVFSDVLNVYRFSVPVFNGGPGWNEVEIFGDFGNDIIEGGHGDDNIFGESGNDTISSFYGYNYISGGLGSDTLDYSWFGDFTSLDVRAGIDADLLERSTFAFNPVAGLRFDDEFFSIENLVGSDFGDILAGDYAGNSIEGGFGWDRIFGRAGDDDLFGQNGNDTLFGGSGRDLIFGGSGDDDLNGGLGSDELNGGSGVDAFVYTSFADSLVALSGRDFIRGFSTADFFDFDAIDADVAVGGNQEFEFRGQNAFSGFGAEVRYGYSGNNTIVEADVNNDGVRDFAITIEGRFELNPGDFIL